MAALAVPTHHPGDVGRRSWLSIALVIASAALAPLAAGGGAGTAATLDLSAVLRIDSIRGNACPPGSPLTLACPARTGAGAVRGLGRVTSAYTFVADTAPAGCASGSVRILSYPVRWVVAGKGELHFALAENPACLGDQVALNATQSYTVTGGTGVYAGATGAGVVERALTQTDTGARGPETWRGTIAVPGLEFDLAPPRISGAAAKTVQAPKSATRVVVRYRPSARDDVDGTVPVTCRPASGSRFKLGRTTVRCSAEDRSGNAAVLSFVVSVRRR